MHLVLFCVERDLVAYFDLPQEALVRDYLLFCAGFRKFLKEQSVLEYLRFARAAGEEDEAALEALNFVANSFFEQLRAEGRLLPYKKDYFN